MERQTTIKKLFQDEEILFTIPSYQRAYSWEVEKDKKQVLQFLIDIKEQNPNKKYFLGHFLFEKDKENKYLVIDGQQRITTIIIFFSCLIRELEKRQKEGTIKEINDTDFETWRIKENYLKFKEDYKFETVSYDNLYFQYVVLEDNDIVRAETSSAKRIYAAKLFFKKELEKAELNEILNWKKVLDNSIITTFEVADKLQASQIFAFQNDRGKDLTTLEKIKAFLMQKIYIYSSENENPENLIRQIETIFTDIYKQSERLTFDENQVLNFYNIAFLKGWEAPLQNAKNDLQKEDNKKEWILDYATNLKEAFLNVEEIEKQLEKNCAIADAILLDTNNTMPLLIKLFHFHKDIELINNLMHKVEKILFKLNYTVADYRTNELNSKSKNYQGNDKALSLDLDNLINIGFQSWWSFTANCKKYFDNNYHYHRAIKYVLWKYENNLRESNRTHTISPNDFKNKFGTKKLENTIDHISPQNPNHTTYTEEFKQNFLNNIGNLSLMVWGDNSEKRNYNPVEKADLFDSDYYSHKEIRDTLNSKKCWTENEITERADRIKSFIFNNWGLK